MAWNINPYPLPSNTIPDVEGVSVYLRGAGQVVLDDDIFANMHEAHKVRVDLLDIIKLISDRDVHANGILSQPEIDFIRTRLHSVEAWRTEHGVDDPQWSNRETGIKQTLPAYGKGVFGPKHKASSFESWSSDYSFDIDHISALRTVEGGHLNLEQVRQIVNADPHTKASYVTSSLDGLRIHVRLYPWFIAKPTTDSFRNKNLKPALMAVDHYYANLLNLPQSQGDKPRVFDAAFDKAAQISFMNHDPEAHWNNTAIPLLWSNNTELQALYAALNWHPYEHGTDTYDEWLHAMFVIRDHVGDIDDRKAIMHIASAMSQGYDRNDSHIEDLAINNATTDIRVGIGSIINAAKEQELEHALGPFTPFKGQEFSAFPRQVSKTWSMDYIEQAIHFLDLEFRQLQAGDTIQIHDNSNLRAIQAMHILETEEDETQQPKMFDTGWHTLNDAMLNELRERINALFDLANANDGWRVDRNNIADTIRYATSRKANPVLDYAVHCSEVATNDPRTWDVITNEFLDVIGVIKSIDRTSTKWSALRRGWQLWFTELVQIARKPGVFQPRISPVLIGDEVIGKTTFGRYIPPNWNMFVSSTVFKDDSMKMMEQVDGRILIEIAEKVTEGGKTSILDDLKRYATQTEVTGRRAYAHESETIKRFWLQYFSTNQDEPLPDDQNTRFLATPLGAYNQLQDWPEKLKPLIDLMWGHAYKVCEVARFNYHENWDEFKPLLEELNLAYTNRGPEARGALSYFLGIRNGRLDDLDGMTTTNAANVVFADPSSTMSDAPDGDNGQQFNFWKAWVNPKDTATRTRLARQFRNELKRRGCSIEKRWTDQILDYEDYVVYEG